MASNMQYIDELMVLIGADASKLLADTDIAVKQVENKYGQMAKNVDKTLKNGVEGALDSTNKKVKESGGFISQLGDTIKNKIGPAKDYFRSLASAGTGAVDTLRNFAVGRASISEVITVLGDLTKAFGPVGVAASLGLAVVLNMAKKVGEALNEVWSMMSPETLNTLGVQTASQFEQYNVQFSVMMGSAEKAKARIQEYAEFGAKTPFNLPEIVQAGKILDQLGGSALATGNGLKLVGDMASASNQSYQAMATYVGRVYNAMQSGRPFGESAQRLQELGLLSGEATNKLEEMQKTGVSGAEQWKYFTDVMAKYNGMMEQQSKTYQGTTTNLEDYQQQIALVGGTPIMDAKKSGLEKQLEFLEKNKKEFKGMSLAIGGIQAAFAKLAEAFKRKLLDNIDFKEFEKIANSIWEVVDLLSANKLADQLSLPAAIAAGINSIADSISWIAEGSTKVARTWAQLNAFFQAGKAAIFELGKAVLDIFGTLNEFNLQNLITGNLPDVDKAMQEIGEKWAKGMESAQGRAKDAFLASADAIAQADINRQKYKDTLTEQTAATEENTEATKDNSDALKQTEAIEKYSEQLLNIQLEHDKQSAELTKNLQEELSKIEQEAQREASEIENAYYEGMNELAKDIEKERYEIYSSNQERLSQIQENYRDQQKAEEESYQKDMAKLRNQYLYDLEDAVKNRDARAIVELRRNYSREKSEATTNYQEQQKKNKENLEKQKQDALQSYQEQMQDLEISIAEKQEKLDADYVKQMQALAASIQQKQAAAQEDYQTQQAQLEGALNRKLESIMLEMEAEKSLTADQAKQILEILARTFGIDGDIDKLMEEFSRRQKMRMDIDVKIKKATESLTGEGGGTTTTGEPSGLPATVGFATGGLMLARKPTLLQVAENGPELFSAAPVSSLGKLNGMGQQQNQQIELKFSGSAPPGVGVTERDQIAKVLVNILDQSGVGQMIRVRR